MVLNFGQVSLVQSEVDRAWGLLNPGKLLDSKWWRTNVAIKGPKLERRIVKEEKGVEGLKLPTCSLPKYCQVAIQAS